MRDWDQQVPTLDTPCCPTCQIILSQYLATPNPNTSNTKKTTLQIAQQKSLLPPCLLLLVMFFPWEKNHCKAIHSPKKTPPPLQGRSWWRCYPRAQPEFGPRTPHGRPTADGKGPAGGFKQQTRGLKHQKWEGKNHHFGFDAFDMFWLITGPWKMGGKFTSEWLFLGNLRDLYDQPWIMGIFYPWKMVDFTNESWISLMDQWTVWENTGIWGGVWWCSL